MTTQDPTNPSPTAAPQVPPGVGGAQPPSAVAPPARPAPLTGVQLECDPEALEPGATVQLFARPTFAARIVGFVPLQGLDVVHCFVGKFKGSAAEVAGKTFDGGSFLIAVVKNLTDGLLIARGCWYVHPLDGAVVPAQVVPAQQAQQAPQAQGSAQVAQVSQARPPASPPAASVITPEMSAALAMPLREASTLPAPASVGSRGVTPGMNEVAILLQRGVAERLLASLHGGAGAALHDSDKSPIERALHNALRGV